MVLILVGAKAIRFSVNTALEKNNCKILLKNWKSDAKYGRSYIHSSI